MTQDAMTSLAPILVAEDDEGDATLLRLAFKRAHITHPLIILRDGKEAVDYLGGDPPYADRAKHPLPAMFLLDLKMPRLNGFEVLAWWSAQRELQDLPVIVLSSSALKMDMDRAKKMGARDYIVKPHGFAQLTDLIQEVCRRWLSVLVCL
jgi:DNA-binding response OmpR family regulator